MADIKDFRLPDLGEGLEDGEIVEWLIAEGEVIELNQPVVSVETAKAVVEIPSPFAGIVVERVGEIGQTLEVGTVFLRIDVDVEGGAVATDDDAATPVADSDASPAQAGFEAGERAAEVAAPDADAAPSDALADDRRSSGALDADEEPQPLVGYGQGAGGSRRRRRRGPGQGSGGAAAAETVAVLAKPPVRKLAKDLGIDLAVLAPGSGPDGVITREDVQAAAGARDDVIDAPAAEAAEAARPDTSASPPSPPPPPIERAGAPADLERPATAVASGIPGFRGRTPGEVEPVRGIRKRIVEKMETSRREIPEATCSRDADLTELWQLRRTLTDHAAADGLDVKITPFVLVMRAAVIALRRFPTLNARFDGGAGEIHLLEHINLGFAADTERGLMVPNIKDAQQRSVADLAQELERLAGEARDGSIEPGALTGGTFTVNNYGAFGNDDGDPIINHPEAGILGIGAIRERPWVVDGELAVRRVARFTLAFDHRVCDGGEAGRFVTYVAELCEQPARLLLHA